ncbi:MAG: hypothetical protein HY754_06865 [Nitrospirae bacterium]|nr:hypothetical protein [Nitrospirota bacterium]
MSKWIIDPDHSVAAFAIKHMMLVDEGLDIASRCDTLRIEHGTYVLHSNIKNDKDSLHSFYQGVGEGIGG